MIALGAAILAVGTYAISYLATQHVAYVDEWYVPIGIFVVGWVTFFSAIRSWLVRVALVLVFGAGAGLLAFRFLQLEQASRARAAHAAVVEAALPDLVALCEHGTPLVSAKAMAPDEAPGSATVLRQRASDESWYVAWNLGDPFEPSAPEAMRAVLCIHSSKVIHEVCSYGNASGRFEFVERVQYRDRATLVAARSGAVLHESTHEGSEPGPCPPQHAVGTNRTVSGSHASTESFLDAHREAIFGRL